MQTEGTHFIYLRLSYYVPIIDSPINYPGKDFCRGMSCLISWCALPLLSLLVGRWVFVEKLRWRKEHQWRPYSSEWSPWQRPNTKLSAISEWSPVRWNRRQNLSFSVTSWTPTWVPVSGVTSSCRDFHQSILQTAQCTLRAGTDSARVVHLYFRICNRRSESKKRPSPSDNWRADTEREFKVYV